MANFYPYSKTVFNWLKFEKATRGIYQVISSYPFKGKPGELSPGFNCRVMILQDDHDYGIDKNGNQRDNNLYEQFNITIANDKVEKPVKGQRIRPLDFISESSYLFDEGPLLRFKNYEVIQRKKTSSK